MDRARITLTHEPLRPSDALDYVADDSAGGTCLFVGTTRRVTDGKVTERLSYEAHESMAVREMERLAAAVLEEWPIHRVAIAHRLGVVESGEASVVIAVSSAHRAEAFTACRALIDRLKQTVPIWKRETFSDGSTGWVDPLG